MKQLETLDINEAPGVIRETVRAVLHSHRLQLVVEVDGALVRLPRERIERVLREIGNNAAQALYSLVEVKP